MGSTADNWNAQRERDRAQDGGGAYYTGEQALARHLADQRREAEAEAARAKAAWDASAEGELQTIEEELAVAGAVASPVEWERAQTALGNVPVPPQPDRWQLPPHLRQRVDDEKLAALFNSKRSDR